MLKNTKNGGSNEPPKFFLDILQKQCYNNRVEISGCSLVVELQPSKLIVWVRFPSSAPQIDHTKDTLSVVWFFFYLCGFSHSCLAVGYPKDMLENRIMNFTVVKVFTFGFSRASCCSHFVRFFEFFSNLFTFTNHHLHEKTPQP